MVRAVMAEAQTARVRARGAANDLMAQADAQQRPPIVDRGLGQTDRSVKSRRIARTGREHEPAHVRREGHARVDGVREHAYPRATRNELTDDVGLEAVVNDS